MIFRLTEGGLTKRINYNQKIRGKNVVCVEIPPYGEKNIVTEGFVHLRLPDTVTWVVKTPLVTESVRYSGKKRDLSKVLR